MLVVVAREHLLPDAFAITELLEVARMHGTIETEQLPYLPCENSERRQEQAPGRVAVYPADQATRNEKRYPAPRTVWM